MRLLFLFFFLRFSLFRLGLGLQLLFADEQFHRLGQLWIDEFLNILASIVRYHLKAAWRALEKEQFLVLAAEFNLVMRLDALAVNNLVARGVILGRGQAQRGTLLASDRQNLLHRALAKGFFADDLGTIVILEAASDNLRGAGAESVHQYHQRQLGPGVPAGRLMLGVLSASLGGDDWLSLGEELFANLDRLVEQAAWVVAQIKHKALHVLQLKLA